MHARRTRPPPSTSSSSDPHQHVSTPRRTPNSAPARDVPPIIHEHRPRRTRAIHTHHPAIRRLRTEPLASPSHFRDAPRPCPPNPPNSPLEPSSEYVNARFSWKTFSRRHSNPPSYPSPAWTTMRKASAWMSSGKPRSTRASSPLENQPFAPIPRPTTHARSPRTFTPCAGAVSLQPIRHFFRRLYAQESCRKVTNSNLSAKRSHSRA